MRKLIILRLASLALVTTLFVACPPAPQGTVTATPPSPTATSTASTVTETTIAAQKGPRNIILLIGDGMGVTQISAGMYMNNNQLHLERFPFIGLHKSYSSDNLVTDSAAGATAFSAGVKTYNGAIAVDPDTLPVPTILEMAEARGLATGLVASSSIVHATPASFIAHNEQRKNYEEIATDFLKTEIDFFIGGGLKFFENRKNDDRNLGTELRSRGYRVENFITADLTKLRPDPRKNFAFFTANGEPLPKASGRDYLLPASRMAPEFLDAHDRNNQGFFLMIEGSQIDWGGHANDSPYIISEMIEFDQVIGEILDFAQRDGETLVIVTADHETGGYAINTGSSMGDIKGAFTSDYHTADLIPVFAYGPGAEQFSGIYENTAIFDKMKKLFGFD
jgi:alkaline phosphatase